MPKVSVIVPIYNVEEYLEECLDSIVNQTFEDMEIICINDGSTDSSLDIINKYADNDSRIKIINQQNKGVSEARNAGLDLASGEYVYCIDSDDYLKPNAIKELYELAINENLDMIIFKINNFYHETGEISEEKDRYYKIEFLDEIIGDKVFSHEDLPSKEIFKIPTVVHDKFFRHDLIRDVRFPEGLIFEDNIFFMESFIKAKRVYFYQKHLYCRRLRSESITGTPSKDYMDFIQISNLLIDLTKKYGLYDEFKEGLYYKTLNHTFMRFTQVSDEDKVEFFKRIKADFLTKKEEYLNDEKFHEIHERLQKIFINAIESDTYKEYLISMKLFDAEFALGKLERKSKIQVTNRDNKIEKLNNRIKRQNATIRELNDNSKELRKEIKQLNKTIDKRNDKIKSLNKTIDEYKNSTSWKITKPLRTVTNTIKGKK